MLMYIESDALRLLQLIPSCMPTLPVLRFISVQRNQTISLVLIQNSESSRKTLHILKVYN